MAGSVKRRWGASHAKSQRGAEESSFFKWLLIGMALLFCLAFLMLPLANVFAQAFSKGWGVYTAALTNPDSWAAIKLSLLVTAITVPLNVLFGLAAAWCIAKFEFRGKALLITLIDLPFSVSPVVAGLMFVVLFGAQGFFGPWLSEHEIKIIFAVPGIVLATVFVTFPFVAREERDRFAGHPPRRATVRRLPRPAPDSRKGRRPHPKVRPTARAVLLTRPAGWLAGRETAARSPA